MQLIPFFFFYRDLTTGGRFHPSVVSECVQFIQTHTHMHTHGHNNSRVLIIKQRD